MRALLDVNVLIALLDANHVHHRRCAQWLAAHLEQGWASCPLTQNGCVRILSQASYPNSVPAAVAAERLHEATLSAEHQFWPDSISLLAPRALDWARLLTGRHLSDAYLLALAVAQQGRLVTLDQNIPSAAVPGAKQRHLAVIG